LEYQQLPEYVKGFYIKRSHYLEGELEHDYILKELSDQAKGPASKEKKRSKKPSKLNFKDEKLAADLLNFAQSSLRKTLDRIEDKKVSKSSGKHQPEVLVKYLPCEGPKYDAKGNVIRDRSI